MIKLVATDIDGTILPYNADFTPGVIECINHLKSLGVKVVIVTGRMDKGARRIAESLKLDTPVVSYNGGYIKTKGGEVLYESYLPQSRTAEIIDWARHNGVHLNLYSDDTLYSESDCEEIRRYARYQKLDYFVKKFDEVGYDRIHKLLAIDYHNPDRVTDWVDTMSERFHDLYIVKSTPYFCEFSSQNATKACAVDFLREYWGLKKEEILTIGDQDNDIELLKAGGVSVAMGNATESLKSVADYITDNVENDGFVQAVEELVLPDYKG